MANDTTKEIALVQNEIEQDLGFSGAKNEEEWMRAFAGRVNWLIVHDFHGLVSFLYRLDVSEAKVKQLLEQQDGTGIHEHDAGTIIASLIIQRQLDKFKTRQQYSRDNSEIPENDRW